MKVTLPKTKKEIIIISIAIVVLIAVLGVAAFYCLEKGRVGRAGDKFVLLPRDEDTAGVDDVRGFILQGPETMTLTEESIRTNLSIKPAFSYYLVENDGGYILKPQQPLAAGESYTFTYLDGENSYRYTYRVRDAAAVLSCSPNGQAGIALDAPLVISFAGGTVIHPDDDITITPKVKGTWTVSGDSVTFHPVKWQAGTYYRVRVADNAAFSGTNRRLAQGKTFSFETQDPAARIPQNQYFSAGDENMTFAVGSEVQIPVYHYKKGEGGEDKAMLEVWAFSDASAYVKGFSPLASLPSWAAITKQKMQVETKGLDKIADSEVSLAANGSDTYVSYPGELEAGSYLFRLILGDQTVDIPVYIGTVDAGYVSDGKYLYIWCHENNAVLAGGTVDWAGQSYPLDGNGFARLPLASEEGGKGTFFTVHAAGESRSIFVRTEPEISGGIFLDKNIYSPAENIAVSGYVQSGGAKPVLPQLQIEGEGVVLLRRDLTLDDSRRFSILLEDSALPEGSYEASLVLAGEMLSSTSFTIADGADLHLSVSQSASAVFRGEEVAFTVKARDKAGSALAGVKITAADSGEKQTTDENGMAVFYRRFSLNGPLAIQEKQMTFSMEEAEQTVSANAYITVLQEGGVLSLTHGTSMDNLCTIEGKVGGCTLTDGDVTTVLYPDVPVTLEIYQINPDENSALLQAEQVITDKNGTFSLSFALDPNASYWVYGKTTDGSGIKNKDSFFLTKNTGGERLLLAGGDDGLQVTDQSAAALLALRYTDGAYTKEETVENVLSLSGMEPLSVLQGESLGADLTASGGNGILVSAQLYQGQLPSAYQEGTAYEEDAVSAFGFAPIVTATYLPGDDGRFRLDLPTQNLSGRYFLRFWLYREGAAPVAYYYPVTIAGDSRLFASAAPAAPEGEEAVLGLYTESSEETGAIRYQIRLVGPNGEEQTFTARAAINESTAYSFGILGRGAYTATVTAEKNDRTIASDTCNFTVYSGDAPAYTADISDGAAAAEGAVKLAVAAEDGEALKTLFSLNLLPGDHLFQVMGQKAISDALGDNTPAMLYRSSGDISSYQNDDGSFSRITGGDGDLLLSALVAENDAMVYNREALASFIRSKSKNNSDREALFLAYWGLSRFSDEALPSMQAYVGDTSLTTKEKLYLAQGLLNLNDTERAKAIYKEVRKNFLPVGGDKPVFYPAVDQDKVFNALLFAHLGLSLGETDLGDFISALLLTENTTMTGRYLLSLCILATVDLDAVTASDTAVEGQTLLAVNPSEINTDHMLTVSYSIGDDQVETANIGDVVKVTVHWGADFQKGNLYLLYITPEAQIDVIDDGVSTVERGRVLLISGDAEASFYLRAISAGSNLAGNIVLFNLTVGTPVGKSDGEGITVK